MLMKSQKCRQLDVLCSIFFYPILPYAIFLIFFFFNPFFQFFLIFLYSLYMLLVSYSELHLRQIRLPRPPTLKYKI